MVQTIRTQVGKGKRRSFAMKGHHLKGLSFFVAGLLAGSVLTGIAAAQPGLSVTATVFNHAQFIFNGEKKPLPEGMTVLNYGGRVYTPARYIAEELGANVGWDPVSQSVLVTWVEPEPEQIIVTLPPEEKPVVEEKEQESEKEVIRPSGDFQRLPIRIQTKDIIVNLPYVRIDERETAFQIETEGRINRPVMIDQRSARMIIDGKEYKHTEVTGVLDQIDQTWFTQNIFEDDKVNGWIRFGPIDEDTEYLIFEVDYVINDNFPERHTLRYEIRL
ncbi:stalk domain-containing protein [Anoxynatronum sibiricum]|uniref:stalk domain-containing protein n=1 Tax=Anoxynatronum sibiricum TaxID=210623 RepID=UPI0031B8476B